MKELIALSMILVFVVSTAVAQTEGESCPCCKPEFRQFDFWLGNWETYQKDKLAGTNEIILLQDSCVLQENWISAAGKYTGTSYNFYNPGTQKWHQTWVDNQGGSLLLSGQLEGRQMVLFSEELPTKEGGTYRNRITWTPNPDGTVRQLWETTQDDGKTWKIVFDGLYKKKN